MAGKLTQTDDFVFEYQGKAEQTEVAFNRLVSTIAETSPELTGFRVELTTTESFEIPISVRPSQETTEDKLEQDTTNEQKSSAKQQAVTESGEETTESASENASEDNEIPSLQSDALPAQVLSLIDEDVEEPVRTNELKEEFDEEIDTTRISQTLASLKRRELVTAEPDPDDNRANIYWTTDRAEQALAQLQNR